MAKAYDSTTKHLIEAHPRDWLALAGMPIPASPDAVSVVDADLSVMTTAADKLIRVSAGDASYLAHVEFQSSADADLDRRILVYNVLGRWRHRMPVRSVVLLLRPQAAAKSVTGSVTEVLAHDARLEFSYRLVRVWELPVETLLSGGLGLLPIAPIAAVDENALPGIVDRMRARLSREVLPEEAKEIWVATQILMGLRYEEQLIENLLTGVYEMEESVTYQAIIQKGFARGLREGERHGRAEGERHGRAEGERQGRAEGERSALIRLGTEKFGSPDAQTLASIRAIDDANSLEQLCVGVLHVSSWDELLES
jgi:predicted transposase YdaD